MKIHPDFQPMLLEMSREMIPWWRNLSRTHITLEGYPKDLIETLLAPMFGMPQGFAFVQAHGILGKTPHPAIVRLIVPYAYAIGAGILRPPRPPIAPEVFMRILAAAEAGARQPWTAITPAEVPTVF